MAFNGSGTYNRPAGQPVVAGTDILDTTFNLLTSDLATALTNCVTRDGQSPPLTNLPMGGFKLSGMGAGTTNGDSVRYEQLTLKAPIDAPTFTTSVSVPVPASAANAVRLDQVSLMPTVASATSPDIFGAAGATINYDNTTPVTATSFTACTAAQVGSTKTLIPTADSAFTCSANLVIDGVSSGTYYLPAGAICTVTPKTTTLFHVTTVSASYIAPSTACTGALTTAIVYTVTKVGRSVTITIPVTMGTATNVTSINFGAALPVAYRPSNILFVQSVCVQINGVNAAGPGVFRINPDGTLLIYRDGAGTTGWGTAANTGVYAATAITFNVQ